MEGQQVLPSVQYPEFCSPYLFAFGGPFTTLEAGTDTLFTNPAVFGVVKERKWSLSKISVSMNPAVFGSFSVLSKSKKTEAFNNFLFENKSILFDFSAIGPLSLALIDKNFGVGIFNRSKVFADVNNDFLKDFIIGEEIFLTGGYGKSFYDEGFNTISLGIQMKGIFQTFSYSLSKTKTEFSTNNSSSYKSIPIVLSTGIGVDLGFLYKYQNIFSLGITCRDIYTPFFLTPYQDYNNYKKGNVNGKTVYKYIVPNLSVGISWIPIYPERYKTVSTLAFYLDYTDMLFSIRNKLRNPALNICFGTEIIFHRVLSFRLGIKECYPHLGCGLDFTYFKIDFSGYLKEGGNKIWEKYIFKLDAGLSFEY